MSAVEIALVDLAVVALPAVLLWAASVRLEDASIVDIAWGLLFVAVAWSTYAMVPERSTRSLCLVVMVTLWGIRLACYLAWRNLGKGEDHRYRALRARIGPRFRWISLFMVFLLQALLVWVISMPLQLGQMHPTEPGITPLVVAGCALFGFGFLFEVVGDWQLARFKAAPENAGRIMDRGLWRYTRHPNYFGECALWWGLFAAFLATPEALLRMGWTAIGPAVLTFLLLRVSGVALLERALKSRRPGYEEYIRRTSAFWPRPPRR